MLPRERVIQVIEKKKPDRIPIYAWLRCHFAKPIAEAYGSFEAFEDKYEFDLAHLFGGPTPYSAERLRPLWEAGGGTLEPRALLDLPLGDPDDMSRYEPLVKDLKHHKGERGRFVYVQTPGILECLNGPFGIENHLMYLLLYEDDLKEVYRRQAEWNRRFANNCLDLGVDMIHVSDDWGSQRGLLCSPEIWRRMIFPYHKITCDAVKKRGGYLSLHSDGNVSAVLDGIVELGYDVVHPYQESSGMDWDLYKRKYLGAFTVMGGLDVQTTIGFGKIDFLKSEIERILRMFPDGGLIYCTSHFVESLCSMEELVLALDTIYRVVRELGKRG